MKRGLLIFLSLIVMMEFGLFGHNLMQAMADGGQDNTGYRKYYTSVLLEEGDTLWKIAGEYSENSGKSVSEYVYELRTMNGLTDDAIHAGNYLTVSYYKADTDLTSGEELCFGQTQVINQDTEN